MTRVRMLRVIFPTYLRRLLARMMLAAVAGLVPAWGTQVLAAPAASPQSFVDDVATLAFKAMDQSHSDQEREKRFMSLLEQDFDVPRISRFVLGKYWASASDQERVGFRAVFETYMARAYSRRLGEYAGETVRVTGLRSEGETATIVNSEIIHQQGSPPVKLVWRIYKSGDDYRIVDISVEGVSMVLTHKEEFASIIERDGSGVAGLIRTIQMKLDGG
jgi:phospholipid transport system substrate-binding protein